MPQCTHQRPSRGSSESAGVSDMLGQTDRRRQSAGGPVLFVYKNVTPWRHAIVGPAERLQPPARSGRRRAVPQRLDF